MFCDEATKTCLYYNRYNCRVTDKINPLNVVENAKMMGINDSKLVIDGGFWSKKCFEGLDNFCSAFTWVCRSI